MQTHVVYGGLNRKQAFHPDHTAIFPFPHASVSLTTPAGRTRLHSLTLSDLDGRFVVDGCGAHSLFNLSGHGQEGLFDIRGVFR